MYIEFRLPHSQYSNLVIDEFLAKWSQKYQVPYTTKIVKSIKRVAFEQDEHYSLFAMTWNTEQLDTLGRWRIVSDPNNKSSFDFVL